MTWDQPEPPSIQTNPDEDASGHPATAGDNPRNGRPTPEGLRIRQPPRPNVNR